MSEKPGVFLTWREFANAFGFLVFLAIILIGVPFLYAVWRAR